MSRYFFHIVCDDLVVDAEGIELPNLAAARNAAADILAEQLKGAGERLWRAKRWRLDVTDTAGTSFATLSVVADTAG